MEETSRRIHLVRHAESVWNSVRRVQGNSCCVGLSPRGIEQARMLGRRLGAMKYDKVFCSDIERAVRTARIALGEDCPIEFSHELREIAFGTWEGKLVSELEEEYPGALDRWFREPSSVKIEGAEPFMEFHARVAREMDRIVGSTSGDLLIISHGGVICAWLTNLLGMHPDRIWSFSLPNTSVTTIMLEFRPRMRLFGDASHLDAATLGFDGMPSGVK